MADEDEVQGIIDEISETLDEAVAELDQAGAQEVYDGVGFHCKTLSSSLDEDMKRSAK